MAKPKKLSTEIMIMIVDSYYVARSDGNEKLMKCSLIAEYAAELGCFAQGYDFRRNMEVREHIEQLKVCAETHIEVYGETYKHSGYKSLDVNEFIYTNKDNTRLVTFVLHNIAAYLTSDLICGIGEKTAKLIVDKFGENTISIIENQPSRLLEISGISQSKLDKIMDTYNQSTGLRNIVAQLPFSRQIWSDSRRMARLDP